MTQVTMRHVRQCSACSTGMRQFMQRNRLDYAQFLREGLPVEVIKATGDAMAIRIAEAAEKEAGENGQG